MIYISAHKHSEPPTYSVRPRVFLFFFKRPTWLIILTRESTKGADGRRFLFMLLLFFLKFPPKCAWSWETRYRPCFCVCALFVNKGNSQMKEKQSFPGPSRSLHGGPVGDKSRALTRRTALRSERAADDAITSLLWLCVGSTIYSKSDWTEKSHTNESVIGHVTVYIWPPRMLAKAG